MAGANRATGSRRPIAAIDIGSNSIFLMIASVDRGRVAIVHRHKDRARLAAAMDANGCLRGDAMNRAMATLKQFRAAADHHGAEIRAVATAAVRGALNSAEFIERASAEAAIQVELISGEAEAELVYLGVRHGGQARDDRLLCVDVGGGSTEVVLGSADQVMVRASAAVGAVAICAGHLGSPPVCRANLAGTRAHIAAAIRPVAGRFSQHNWNRAIATSGTIQRLARMINARGKGGRNQGIDGLIITAQDIDRIVDQLVGCASLAEVLALPGMDPQRADILLGGALIFQELGRAMAIDRWTVSKAGLRMGIVADVLRRRGLLRLDDT